MINEPINVTDPAFEKTVLQSSLPVIVDFGHPGVDLVKWLPQF